MLSFAFTFAFGADGQKIGIQVVTNRVLQVFSSEIPYIIGPETSEIS
jgi:hypothetical protein